MAEMMPPQGAPVPQGGPAQGPPQPPDFQQGAASFQQHQQQGTVAQLAQRHGQVAIDDATLRMGRALLRSVDDEHSFQVLKRMVAVMMGPQMAAALGQNYEQGKPRIAAMLAHSAIVARHVHSHGRAMELVKQALAADGEAGHPLWRGAVGTALSTARNGDEWRAILAEMQQAGAPHHVLNQFDTVYSPTGASKALTTAGPAAVPAFDRFAESAVRR